MFIEEKARYQGCFVGLAVGDALGAPYEFLIKSAVQYNHQMNAGGFFNLPKGAYTDDTSMNMCLAESILTTDFFDIHDQIQKYISWYVNGEYSSTNECFDIGNQTRMALDHYINHNEFLFDMFTYSAENDRSSGNGSLMRIAPVAMAYKDIELVKAYALESSKTTHPNNQCQHMCSQYAQMIRIALDGGTKEDIICVQPTLRSIKESDLRNSGYVLDSYLMCTYAFFNTDTFEDCMRFVIEQGGDADTNACIAGMLAGAFYGIDEIPPVWINDLMHSELMFGYANRLYEYSRK